MVFPEAYIRDDQAAGRFHVRRDIFSDPEIFELEMARLFEGGWVFLAHDSQLPRPHDYFTTWMGRRPVVLMRDGEGEVRAFLNSCPHRGAQVCRQDRGNTKLHVCPFHSWSFDSSGRLRGLKARDEGAYSEHFLNDDHNLVPIARFESYRGFLFGSLEANVESLREYLGDAAVMLDLVIDQSPDGSEILPGVSSYTYEGNWKAQLENCTDGYHVTSVHPTYLQMAERRAGSHGGGVESVWERMNLALNDSTGEATSGSLCFRNGHAVSWGATPLTPGHPLFGVADELRGRVGEVRAKWMIHLRNLTIFPNVQIAENFSSQLRIMRPLAPGRTEMVTYCIGPKGEAAETRRVRLRQHEDFFMPTGMATPDDMAMYEECYRGHVAADDLWLQGYERGVSLQARGGGPEGRELGIEPLHSVRGSGQIGDETIFHTYYRAWLERLSAPGPGKRP